MRAKLVNPTSLKIFLKQTDILNQTKWQLHYLCIQHSALSNGLKLFCVCMCVAKLLKHDFLYILITFANDNISYFSKFYFPKFTGLYPTLDVFQLSRNASTEI